MPRRIGVFIAALILIAASASAQGVEASVSVGASCPAETAMTMPPVRVCGAVLLLIVELSIAIATLPLTSIAPAVAGEELPEIVELTMVAFIVSPAPWRSAAVLNATIPPPRVRSDAVASTSELPEISERSIRKDFMCTCMPPLR